MKPDRMPICTPIWPSDRLRPPDSMGVKAKRGYLSVRHRPYVSNEEWEGDRTYATKIMFPTSVIVNRLARVAIVFEGSEDHGILSLES